MSPALPASSPLTAADEGIHEIDPAEHTWREAYVFDIVDPGTGITGVCYAGVHPNAGTGDFAYCLWKDGVMVDEFVEFNCNIPQDIGEERFRFSRGGFTVSEPFEVRHWYVNNNGRSVVDLTWRASNPPYDWRDSRQDLAASGSHHYEHMGRYTGTIEIHGKSYEVSDEATGFMDHAWGWGKRANLEAWVFFSVHFGDDFVVNGLQQLTGDGSERLFGYIYRGDENVPIRRCKSKIGYHPVGLHQDAFEFEMEGINGDIVSAKATDFLNLFNNSHIERNKTGHHFWRWAKFDCEGQAGYGMTNFYWRSLASRPSDWEVTLPPDVDAPRSTE